jgi:hypothetical protein
MVRRYCEGCDSLMIKRTAIRAASTVVIMLSRIVAALSLFMALTVNIGAVRRARAILLVSNGGFGHTITGPDWLRRLHPGSGNLTFFAMNKADGRHNLLITELWGPSNFFWVRKGIALPILGSVYDADWLALIFHAAKRFLKWFVPNTPSYCSYDDLIAATPAPPWLASRHPFNQRYESRYYHLIQERPAPALHVGTSMRRDVTRALNDRFGTNFPRRCAFYIRYLTEPNSTDFSSINRLSAPLEDYLPAIRILNSYGFQVLLTGDLPAERSLIDKMAGAAVDWRAVGVDPDKFRIFAGTEVDLHIGSLSGGSAYVLVTDIPALMLNAFAPGDALPRTTVGYKWIYESDGSMASLDELLGGKFYDHQLHGCRMVDCSPEEMAEIVEDFIIHRGTFPHGVDPAELGIDAPWIRAANARISPVWLKQYHRRLDLAKLRVVCQ